MDTLVYGSSMSDFSSQRDDHLFVDKQLKYIIDSNNNSYTRNQIDFDTVSMGSNGKWVDYQNGFIVLPCHFQFRSDVVTDLATATKAIRVKNNLALIDSVAVNYNNTNVIQETSEMCNYSIFNQHTTLSRDDLDKSDVYGYTKDSPYYKYDAGAGLVNAVGTLSTFDRTENPWVTPVPGILTEQNLIDSGVPYAVDNSTSTDSIYDFYYNAKIMLKDLSFFNKLPLLKGSNVKLTLRLNQGSVSMTTTTAGGSVITTNLKGSAFPLMRIDVPNNSTETLQFVVYNTCRLYAPVYQMSSQFENQYLSLGTKKILYNDIYVKHIRNKSGKLNEFITNSLSRTTRLIVIPMLSRDSNSSDILPNESPLCSAPNIVTPHYAQLNLKISTKNVYSENVQYKFEHFMNEMGGDMERGSSSGLNKGLIGYKDYLSTYGYFVVDLKRRYPEDDMTGLSFELFGEIKSAPLDLLCILEYEKDCVIDIATGQLLQA